MDGNDVVKEEAGLLASFFMTFFTFYLTWISRAGAREYIKSFRDAEGDV